jgi:hypothetical protein
MPRLEAVDEDTLRAYYNGLDIPRRIREGSVTARVIASNELSKDDCRRKGLPSGTLS